MPEPLTTVTDPVAATPIPAVERIQSLDILRGMALSGMIFVHFHQELGLDAAKGIDGTIRWFVYVFAEEKAWGTFAFLFGAGFAVLLRRLHARGAAVTMVYLRRMAVLAVLGIIAQVGFGFAVLFDYAICGVLLLLMRKWSTRTLLVVAAVCASWLSIFGAVQWIYLTLTGNAASAPADVALYRALEAARSQPSYLVLLAARWNVFVAGLLHGTMRFTLGVNLLLFILGLLAMRHGLLENPTRHARTIRNWMIAGALSWAASQTIGIVLGARIMNVPLPLRPPVWMGFGLFQDEGLSLTYIGAVVLLLAYAPQWTTRLGAIFGMAGRMALTNYILQVIVFDVLASGYGFAVKVRPILYPPGAIALFGVEVLLSRLWLARYRFGPLEWIWRCATYLHRQRLRRAELQPIATTAAVSLKTMAVP